MNAIERLRAALDELSEVLDDTDADLVESRDALAAVDALYQAASEVRHAGIVLDDARLGYVEIQVDRAAFAALAAAVRRVDGEA